MRTRGKICIYCSNLVRLNETVAGITGTNYLQKWTGMSDDWYNGLYTGFNIASFVGNLAGNAYMKYANVRVYGNNINEIEGVKPFKRFSLYDDNGIKRYRYFNSSGQAWYDKDFRHGGTFHKFPHYNVWEGKNRSKLDRSFLDLVKWLLFGK